MSSFPHPALRTRRLPPAPQRLLSPRRLWPPLPGPRVPPWAVSPPPSPPGPPLPRGAESCGEGGRAAAPGHGGDTEPRGQGGTGPGGQRGTARGAGDAAAAARPQRRRPERAEGPGNRGVPGAGGAAPGGCWVSAAAKGQKHRQNPHKGHKSHGELVKEQKLWRGRGAESPGSALPGLPLPRCEHPGPLLLPFWGRKVGFGRFLPHQVCRLKSDQDPGQTKLSGGAGFPEGFPCTIPGTSSPNSVTAR